jgi:hypothetical protein
VPRRAAEGGADREARPVLAAGIIASVLNLILPEEPPEDDTPDTVEDESAGGEEGVEEVDGNHAKDADEKV